ncbi:MAG TPA: RHS repeat-associated core domain-containing protein [Chthoniobacterales bacterium]|nr:RHS repeat-associated core domain-containing protein [Chthoniobacterales bacterium]
MNDGLLRKVVDPLGNATTFTYNATGQVLTMTDARQNAGGGSPAPSVSNTYFANGNLQTTQDALGNVTSYTYDASGNRHTETKSVTVNGNTQTLVTTTNYDSTGFLQQTIDPAGHVTTFVGDANNNVLKETTSRTDSNGATVAVVTEHEHDEQDRLIRTWNAENPRQSATAPSSETVYNTLGKAEFVYDALRHVTHNEYDDRGYLAKVTYPDGNFELTSYDKEGRRQFFTDRGGRKTQYHYDVVGHLDQTIFLGTGANGPVVLSSSTFDAAGRVITSTDANNNTTKSIYDDAGRRVGTLNAKSELSRFGYDANGNQTSFADALNRTTTYGYDALNRRVSTLFPPSEVDVNGTLVTTATETVTAYDELGRRVVEYEQSPVGISLGQRHSKQFVYDALGRLTDLIDASGQDTHYSYDELGNQLSQRDANQHTSIYSYDNLGRRISRTLPLGQSELNTYDANGNLRFRRDFNGHTTEYRYDAINRLLTKIPDGSLGNPSVGYTYTPTGKRGSMSDASGATTYSYTERDQLQNKITPFGTLSYSYYPTGSLASMQSSNANGVSIGYQYDVLNRLEHVVDTNTGTTNYAYDSVGNLDHFTYPNGVKHAYGYDALNRLKGLSVNNNANAVLAGYGYTVAPIGQRTAVQENTGRSVGYTYDNLHRLIREGIAGAPGINGVITYIYDNVGNRQSRTSSVPGVSNQSFGYDANDRLTSDSYDANGNTKVGHLDANGTLQTVNDAYDFENHLTSRNNGAVQVTYDGDGNKVQETNNGHTVAYLIDDQNPTGYAQVVDELVNGAVTRSYTFGHDLLCEDQLIGGNWSASFYGYDGHGSVRLLINNAGQVTDTYTYDAFGQLIQSFGTTPNDYRYSGEQLDPNLGLYYLRARYLSAANGRFWTMDSYEGKAADPLSLHKYLYCAADPLNNHDPSGYVIVSNFIYGNIVHDEIAADFTTKFAEGVSDRTINSVLGTNSVFGNLRPDLVDLASHQVWEIKPVLTGQIAGSAQLLIYLAILNTQDPGHHVWLPGYSYVPVPVVPIKPGTVAFVFPPLGGVILYEVVDSGEAALGLAALAGFLAFKEIEADIATAALIEEL